MGPGHRTTAAVETKRPCLQHLHRRLGAERRGVPTVPGPGCSARHKVTRRRNRQCQMQFQVDQTGGCDDVAYSGRMLGRGAVVECQCQPEARRIEPELVEREWQRDLRAMREAVISTPGRIQPAAPTCQNKWLNLT